jgi:hypothetical protein
MDLSIVGCSLTEVGFGYRVVLTLHPAAQLIIGDTFDFRSVSGESHVVEVDSPEQLARVSPLLVALVGRSLRVAAVNVDGRLLLEFDEGSVIRVGPSARYESFDLLFPGRVPSRILSTPGGALEIWD